MIFIFSSVRTDIALEAGLRFSEGNESPISVPGLDIDFSEKHGFRTETVRISSEEAADIIGKPVGSYYTLSLEQLIERRSKAFPQACEILSGIIRSCLPQSFNHVLIAALGNPQITPDNLGPETAESILVTRHMKSCAPKEFSDFCCVSVCRTGVLGTTGIESAEHIRTLCSVLKPDAVIAVDALAGSDFSRLCRTVQISSSGIAPGSGIGNNREALNEEYLGVPVIAIGVPTVIDSSILSDSNESAGCFLCSRSIDSDIRTLGRLIAYSVNFALHSNLTLADLDMLLG